ncbi:MAG: EAL domain-containing protein [Lachnospiraceae bacterium]|nr:EAL domain-containing protein [Lachnospiraceae bacterium]
MKKINTVLIVEDQEVNRKIVKRILQEQYDVLEADNGKKALELVEEHSEIGVILLDLIMPVMDGFSFLARIQDIGKGTIPVVVMTANNDAAMEIKSLQAGAIDYVSKPVNPDILRHRVRKAMDRNQMLMYQQMEYFSAHDTLTELYNRRKMFEETRIMLDTHPNVEFAFMRFDIDKFRLYNSAMGEKEGDKLLLYAAQGIRTVAADFEVCTYGRIDADVFCLCAPYEQDVIMHLVERQCLFLTEYRKDYTFDSSVGIYVIDDRKLSVETIFTRASMAAYKCKNNFDVRYAYYENSMGQKVEEEQKITNEMRSALEQEQFVVYLQPKYDLLTDLPAGAEALVRWMHPEKGIISPGIFIPVFEKNGFIANLDYYMWEHVCMLLHKWLEQGKVVAPVSVNVSRISLYNPNVDEKLLELVRKYEIDPKLLQIEVTESAYMMNPEMMAQTIGTLREEGFTILMDDFGSGYSSLNTLKDISIDVLKLDMKFLSAGKDETKGEKIISSIVRMAGWLGMEVIAEGVETREQKQFLESVGCGYVQGYYYAKPMPVEAYEKLMEEKIDIKVAMAEGISEENTEAIWSSDPRIEQVLSGVELPVAIMEYAHSGVEIIRTNKNYQAEFSVEAMQHSREQLDPMDTARVKQMFDAIVNENKSSMCEVTYMKSNECRWVRIKARRIMKVANATLLCCVFEDITAEKVYENRLANIINLFDTNERKSKILVVDDLEISRANIRSMFENQFDILEAKDGEEGMDMLHANLEHISVILLDMMMPKMDGAAFLKEKNKMKNAADIPVIVISAEDSASIQLGMLKNGVNDYILKPFDPDITRQRVENVISYKSRFNQLIREYKRDILEKDS